MSERSDALSYPAHRLHRMRVALGAARLVVANSPGGAQYWREQGFDPCRIEIVPNFVPLTR